MKNVCLCRIALVLVAGLLAANLPRLSRLSLLGAVARAQVTSQPSTEAATEPSTQPSREQLYVSEIHDAYGAISDNLRLSDDEKARVAEIEKSVVGAAAADPSKLDDNYAFEEAQDAAIAKMRDALTPDHQQKFDEIMAGTKKIRARLRTETNLKQVGGACIICANLFGGGQFPDDLGVAMQNLGGVSPHTFLVSDSSTQVPADFAQWDLGKKGNWVKANTDFVYLAGGKTMVAIPPDFVMVYIKPSVATDGNIFLLGDGSIKEIDADTATKAIAEIQAGQNPPPSLKTQP